MVFCGRLAGNSFMSESAEAVTQILEAIGAGDQHAAEELLPLVYEELRRLAAARMAQEAPGQTLQATALVHEAWLRLVGNQRQEWNGRGHFFGAAAEAMRRILIENARRKRAQRHGGDQVKLDLQHVEVAAPAEDDELLALDEALTRFAERDKQKAELVEAPLFRWPHQRRGSRAARNIHSHGRSLVEFQPRLAVRGN
jgi:RNA polymerase sigma factor (TIGR02999 family)